MIDVASGIHFSSASQRFGLPQGTILPACMQTTESHVTNRKHDLPTSSDSTHQRIRAVIRAIPYGQVRAYSEVAMAAGLPGRARLVAKVLAQSSEEDALPWHRVLRADGRIAFATNSDAFEAQRVRLEAEGVDVRNGRVTRHRSTTLDAMLWQP
jgi:methylated-DNA-protein-cysteine methyltransferase related protein